MDHSPLPSDRDQHDPTILLVGDDRNALAAIVAALRAAGFRELSVADEASLTAESLLELRPEILIVRPSTGGEGAGRLLARLDDLVPVDDPLPVLVVSDAGRADLRQAILARPDTDLLIEPVAPPEPPVRVLGLLRQRRQVRALRQQRQQLETLLKLQQEVLTAPPESLYDHVLGAAVDTVPGAEAGSLLVREGDRFRFRAAVGFDLARLQRVTFSAEDMQKWHGGGPAEWLRAVPRIVTREKVDLTAAADRPPPLAESGRLTEIHANLYFPVVYRGEVLAVLNLDNLHDSGAFTESSIQAARTFSVAVATLLHEAHYRRLLEEVAVTDPLTGLKNRRAFDDALSGELARSRRHRQPFCVLMMDLQNFKLVNDRLGHRRGDEVLIRLATELRHQLRPADLLSRWGGDEFAALLPLTGHEGATAVALRCAEAIAQVEEHGLQLRVNIGAAAFPDDGEEADALLASADRRMYAAKAAGVAVLESDQGPDSSSLHRAG